MFDIKHNKLTNYWHFWKRSLFKHSQTAELFSFCHLIKRSRPHTREKDTDEPMSESVFVIKNVEHVNNTFIAF